MICPIYSSVSRVPMAALNLWLPVYFSPANAHHLNRTLPLGAAMADFTATTGQTVPYGTLLEAMHYYAVESGYLVLNPPALGGLDSNERHPYRTLFIKGEDDEKALAFHMLTDRIIFPELARSMNQTKKGTPQ